MAGFFDDLQYGITRPIRDLIELGNIIQKGYGVKRVEAPIFTQQELLRMADQGGSKVFFNDPRYQKYGQDLKKAQAAYKEISNYKPIAVREDDMEGLLQYDRALKDAAIAGSLMAPGGGSLLRAIGGGLLSGGLAGYGQSKRGEELGSALGGMALGGLFGGGGYMLGKLGSKMFNNQAQKLSYKELMGRYPGLLKDIGGIQNAEAYTAQIDDLLRAKKLPMRTAGDRAKSIEILKNMVGKDIGALAEASGSKIKGDTLLARAIESTDTLTRNNKDELLERLFNEISKRVDDAGELSTKSVQEITEAMTAAGGGYEKLAGEGGKIEAANAIKEAIRKILVGDADSKIAGMAPELAEPKSIYSMLSKVDDAVNRLESSSGEGFRYYGQRLPGSEILDPVMDTITRGAKNIAHGAGKVLGAPGAMVEKIGSPKVAGALTNLQMARMSGQPEDPGQGQMPTDESMYAEWIDPATGFLKMPDGRGGFIDESAMYGGGEEMAQDYTIMDGLRDAARVFPNGSESELMSLAMKFVEQNNGSKVDASTQAKLDEAQQGLDLIGVLKGQYRTVQDLGLTAGGPWLGRLRGLRGSIASASQSSPEAAAYQNTVSAFLSKLSRAAGERGVLTDQDVDRIARAIPGFYDTPKTAEEQWRLIENIIGSAISNYRGNPTGYGSVDQLGNLGYGGY